MEDLKLQLEAVLDQFWEQNVIEAASEDGSNVDEMLIPLDSITACESLLDIEPLVGKELPIEQIVRKGGYQSKDEFISAVSDAVLKYVEATS